MGNQAPDMHENRLWIESAANRLGVDRVAGPWAPYILIIIIEILLRVLGYLERFAWDTPIPLWASVLGIVGLLFGIWASRQFRDSFEDVIPSLNQRVQPTIECQTLDEPSSLARRILLWMYGADGKGNPFLSMAPKRLKGGVVIIGLLFHFSWNWIIGFENLTDTYGPMQATVMVGFIHPFYYLIAADFIGGIVGINVFVPMEIKEFEAIDSTDPEGYYGLRPVGGLIERTVIVFAIGLGIFALFNEYGMIFAAGQTVNTIVLFIATVVGGILYLFPVYVLHHVMREHRRAMIEGIASDIKTLDGHSERKHLEIPYEKLDQDTALEYLYNSIRLASARRTKEFPVDRTITQQVFVVLILPLATEVVVTYLLTFS